MKRILLSIGRLGSARERLVCGSQIRLSGQWARQRIMNLGRVALRMHDGLHLDWNVISVSAYLCEKRALVRSAEVNAMTRNM